MNSFEELIRERRSVRRFKDETVPPEIIERIIEDSTLAPSTGNEQPWEYIIVSNRSLMDEIAQDCKESILKRIAENPGDYVQKYERMLSKEGFNIFYNAPAVVFIVGSKDLKNTEINCTLAASYFMMSATARGLGSCWISFGRHIQDKAIKDRMALNDNHLIVAPIILGYPEIIPEIPPRKPVSVLQRIP